MVRGGFPKFFDFLNFLSFCVRQCSQNSRPSENGPGRMKVCAANVCGSAPSLGSGLITPALLVHSHFHNVATWDEDGDDDEEEEEEEAMYIFIVGDQLTMDTI